MTATYRLQLHAGFTFADAADQVPYLADLGVTHLYLSPVLQAAPGSMHGYDVVDHTRVSEELGGEEQLLDLAAAAREHGLGVVVDVVPNHMALVAPETLNAPLWQLLAEGRDAPTAHWFDVDWEAGEGRLGLPILGGPLEEVLARGEITRDQHDGQPVLRYFDHVLPLAKGTEDGDLADVVERQHYRLASWRAKDTVLNYRRFFDVDTLIAVRVELPDVFETTHRLLLDLNRRGVVEGFRIDHPDGLADPQGYLRMLREAVRPGTGIWVEKILEGQERLPEDWACDGTTGYDALTAVTAALTDPTTAPVLTEAWVRAGGDPDLHAVELAAKRQVVDELLGPEVQRLTRRACEALPDLDADDVRQAVVELLVGGDVYRAYLRPGEPLSEVARARLDAVLRVAVQSRPDLERVLREVATLLSGDRAPDFAIRFQQTWGPVMAKGIEDTTFYRWHRFVALNEVGGDPMLLDDAAPEVMHAWAANQQEQWPLGMTTLSTHDTKRSEDVRARLLALGGDGEAWDRLTDAFVEASDAHGVDRPTGHLVWQTVAGVGAVPEERLHGYLDKALRESKQHTRWTDPDEEYEGRVRGLADAATRPGTPRALLDTAMQHQADAVRCVVLGQKLLQLTLPGVPDIYQGCELVDLSLVDPDNRRPVDYAERSRRLARLATQPPADLDDEKLLVTSRALALRRQERDAFGDAGGYTPLTSTSRHLVGFLRGQTVAVAATRAPQRLAAAGGWGEHAVALRDGTWRDVLTGALHRGGDVRCAELFTTLPVALLQRVEA